jgi:hypothetical protein
VATVLDAIRELSDRGVKEEIEDAMTGPQVDAVNDEWARLGNISWFEAFSIWLLKERGFDALP